MNSSSSSYSQATAIRFLYVAAILILAGGASHAKSDTDVYVTKAKSVKIEEGKITIVAEAETTRINIFRRPPKTKEAQKRIAKDSASSAQSASTQTPIGYTNRRTFVIRRPILNFNDPKGILGEERAQYQKTFDDAWEMSLKAALALQNGKRVGRIGFYRPTFLADSIDGFGYLYPARQQEAEPDGAGQPTTAPESTSEGNEEPKPASEARPQ